MCRVKLIKMGRYKGGSVLECIEWFGRFGFRKRQYMELWPWESAIQSALALDSLGSMIRSALASKCLGSTNQGILALRNLGLGR